MVDLTPYGQYDPHTKSYKTAGVNVRRDTSGQYQVPDIDYREVLSAVKNDPNFVENHKRRSQPFRVSSGRYYYFQKKTGFLSSKVKIFVKPTKSLKEEEELKKEA